VAVLAGLVEAGALDGDATVCAIVTETGLKTEAPPPDRAGVVLDEAALRRLVLERLGEAVSP
jgi:hypothetical protein